ncbi:MAG: SpoIIE family protein phosphatase, partial [Roseiflexaceae bacterium]|nr:SpoIIE family protein phosphatase [Roseiflexaceae bacterium]
IVASTPILDELRSSTQGTNSIAYLIDTTTTAAVLDDGRPRFTLPDQHAQLFARTGDVQEYAGARDVSVVGATNLVVPMSGVATNLAVVVEQPAGVAFADLRRSLWVLALVIVLVDGLVLIWAIRQARLITEPLKALRSGANLVGSGHLDHRIGVTSADELGEVATAFNQMTGHLQQSLAQIEQQNEHLRQGLALARDIQLGLLPDLAPWGSDELVVFARSIPAYEVGGDFYTYLALPEGRAAIAIGDISGKGVGAALLMSLTSSAVESHGRELEHPAEVLSALNRQLAPRLKANHMNAALMFVVFDARARQLRVANAGMIAPMLIGEAGSHFLDVGGLPIGAYAGARYHEITYDLQAGDTLLLLSDGVVEAHNASGEMFGFDRLETLLNDARPLGDVRVVVELVVAEVQAFIGDAEQHDDITLVAVRPAVLVNAAVEEEQAAGYAVV